MARRTHPPARLSPAWVLRNSQRLIAGHSAGGSACTSWGGVGSAELRSAGFRELSVRPGLGQRTYLSRPQYLHLENGGLEHTVSETCPNPDTCWPQQPGEAGLLKGWVGCSLTGSIPSVTWLLGKLAPHPKGSRAVSPLARSPTLRAVVGTMAIFPDCTSSAGAKTLGKGLQGQPASSE